MDTRRCLKERLQQYKAHTTLTETNLPTEVSERMQLISTLMVDFINANFFQVRANTMQSQWLKTGKMEY